MKKCVIFGAGVTGFELLESIEADGIYDVIAYIDNDENKWGKKLNEIPIYRPGYLVEIEYDIVLLASTMNPPEMVEQLKGMGIDRNKINETYSQSSHNAKRVWLRDFAKTISHESGNVAEAGVYKGDFAKEINASFPDKKLYLFDTFEGYDSRDIDESTREDVLAGGHLSDTTEELVLGKMPHPEQCIIMKGYFPDSTVGVEDTFCFVNLDMDLYLPTLAGLRFFYPRLTPGGVILIHGYFTSFYGKQLQKAIAEYAGESNANFRMVPIGDGSSIALLPR